MPNLIHYIELLRGESQGQLDRSITHWNIVEYSK